jgi:hypothetical protein
MNIQSFFTIKVKNLNENYNPLYFLSSLGAGGLMVSFFMYFQFMIPHKDIPMVTFEHIWKAFDSGSPLIKVGIILTYIAIIFFTFKHYQLLFWNLKELKKFKTTDSYTNYIKSATGIGQMARPLTFAMTVNVFVILAVIFIPGIWNHSETLFPISITAFLIIGLDASKIFMQHLGRIVLHGDSEFVNGNNLSQILASFTFAMVAVGFSAPGAMSHHPQINAIAFFFAIFFTSLSILIGFLKFILGIRAIFEKGIEWTAGPTLWLSIPILTLVGITVTRLLFGLDHHADFPLPKSWLFVLGSFILTLQIVNGMFGYYVMKEQNYFSRFVKGKEKTVGSLSLICPGVALVIYGFFMLHFGMVQTNLLSKFSVAYFLFLTPLVLIQIITILTYFKLGKKLLYDK